MKEKPITFIAPMVQAILEGRKTQTRRIVKVQPPGEGYVLAQCVSTTGPRRNEGRYRWVKRNGHELIDCSQTYCSKPYAIGDRLWVKETYCYHDDLARCLYKADGINSLKWNPSIHMPRWASRITLEVTGVRVERLQDISEEDAIAEGLKALTKDNGQTIKYGIPDADGLPGKDDFGWPWMEWNASPALAYKKLWEQIYGPGAWDKNPWAWVIEFKRVEEK